VEERANDLEKLPLPVIWLNCLYVDIVPVIWQNCLYVEDRASDLAELSVCGQCGRHFCRIACMWMSVPVILQNFLSVDSVPVI
jgi:hypothetical protein